MDVMWNDIEHTDAYRWLTFNPTHFSDPEAMQREIAATKRNTVSIADPHFLIDKSYEVYEHLATCDGHEGYCTLRNRDGGMYEGECWPGSWGSVVPGGDWSAALLSCNVR